MPYVCRMKKLLYIVLLSVFYTLSSQAQDKVQVSVHLNIPIMIHHSYHDGVDASKDEDLIEPYSITSQFTNGKYSFNGDSIYFLLDRSQWAIIDKEFFLIDLDTIQRTLDIHYLYNYDYHYRQTNRISLKEVRLISIPYQILDNNKIFGFLLGNQLIDYLDTLNYREESSSEQVCFNGNHISYQTDTLVKVISDSKDTVFLITLSPTSINRVQSQPNNFQSLRISKINEYFNFFFPSSTHPETLFIYDILGREAARFEIAAGMTQYSMNSSRFPSGHYFARLGNMTAHFEVY